MSSDGHTPARFRLRKPEYTGRNRCVPCTVVNVALAVVLTALVAIESRTLAVGVGVGSLVLIYLRGYLVPGTPALTKRYLPARVLAWFDKQPMTATDGTFDPGSVLLRADLLAPTPDGTDLRLDLVFATRWASRTQALLEADVDGEQTALAALLDVSTDDLLIADGETGLAAYLDGQLLGSWPSWTAFFADMAGMELLAERVDEWDRLSVSMRSEVAGTLRLFAESCPRCGGLVELDETVRESCCSTHEVVTAACRACGTRLLELPLSEEMRAAMNEQD